MEHQQNLHGWMLTVASLGSNLHAIPIIIDELIVRLTFCMTDNKHVA